MFTVLTSKISLNRISALLFDLDEAIADFYIKIFSKASVN